MIIIIIVSCVLICVSIKNRGPANNCMIAILCILWGVLSILKDIPQLDDFSIVLSSLANVMVIAIPFALIIWDRKGCENYNDEH